MKQIDKTERLLALLLLEQMKNVTQKEQVLKLNIAGFSNIEIADILQMSSLNVAKALYKASKTTKRSRK